MNNNFSGQALQVLGQVKVLGPQSQGHGLEDANTENKHAHVARTRSFWQLTRSAELHCYCCNWIVNLRHLLHLACIFAYLLYCSLYISLTCSRFICIARQVGLDSLPTPTAKVNVLLVMSETRLTNWSCFSLWSLLLITNTASCRKLRWHIIIIWHLHKAVGRAKYSDCTRSSKF